MITMVGPKPTMKHIQDAPDLTGVGTLTSLNVDNLTIDGTTISTGSGNPLTFTSDGPITISNSTTIRGLPTPTQGTDAASKSYVDDTVNGERVAFSLDITGLSDAQILLVVEDIVPASTKKEGTQAYIHCTSTTGATATFSASTLNNALSKTVTSVDKTITASPQTIVSVVKQANTRLTLGGTHGYEGGQSVTISGATGLTALNGTFTISNGGVYGSLMSSPILNYPQSGILGMHKIQERPIAINGNVIIKPMMYLALSYDHRIVDGKGAVTFLVRVKEMLEDPHRLLMDV